MEDAVTAAISSAAASLESASATSDTSTAPTGDTGTTDTGSTTSSDPTGAVDIPSGEPAAEVAADPNAEVVAEEVQDPNAPAGHMPLHRHKAVLTNERNKSKAALDAVQAQLESLKWAQNPEMPDRLKALEIAEQNPELFVQVLKQDPRYAKLLNTPAEQPAQPQKPQAPALGERPGPDRQDDQGNVFYSQEQAAALQEWIEQAQEARTKALFEERFAPIEKERKEVAERKVQDQMWGQAIERQKSVLTDARATWPLFGELETAIKADLAKNKTMTLETAYRRAFAPRVQANRDAMRKEILAELNNRPPVAASTRPGPGPAVKAGQQTTEDIIMAHARALEGRS